MEVDWSSGLKSHLERDLIYLMLHFVCWAGCHKYVIIPNARKAKKTSQLWILF